MIITDIEKQAREVWKTFDDNERFGVKFGLFPADKMPDLKGDEGREFAVALMNLAKLEK